MPEFYQNLKTRLVEYMMAVQTEHEDGPPYMVGKVFAELCGNENDAVIIYMGGLQFAGTFQQVSDVLNSIEIKN